jgi:hypothetical protein
MKTDDVKRIAENGPLDQDTLDSIGLNLEALNIFVKRLGTAAENKILKIIALERIKQAYLVRERDLVIKERDQLINNISKSIRVDLMFGSCVCVCRLIFADRKWR